MSGEEDDEEAGINGRILYISYDGMLEPLGQSQVLAYIKGLAKVGWDIHLMSYEKASDWDMSEQRTVIAEALRTHKITWHPFRYHKNPTALATAWDIAVGIAFAVYIAVRYKVQIVHARSYVASVIALTLKKALPVRFIFDMRGFWADERVDGGLWSRGSRMYRVAKWFERHFLVSADEVVSLTQAGVDEMRKFAYLQGRNLAFTVIPTCADLRLFVPAPRRMQEPFVLGYVGSAGTWYLFDEAAACFRQLLQIRPNAQLLIVNRGEHEFIRQRLHAAGVPERSFVITSAAHQDIPALMGRMHAGLFFIKPAFSKLASAPTKLAEFLGCGVPCLSNTQVGDMANLLHRENVGVAVANFDPRTLASAIEELLRLAMDPGVTARCVAAAHKNFSLEEGVLRYHKLYSKHATVSE